MFGIVKKIIKYAIIWCKYHKQLKFYFSSNIALDSEFEGVNKIYQSTKFRGKMGYGSYMGPYCDITAEIGRFTSIAPYVRTSSGRHPYTNPFVTTSPMFFSTRKQNGDTFATAMMYEEEIENPCIGSDCWIGENVFISGGVKVNDGAVVLAGAVVVKDVPPFSIVGGVPAKVLKYRYDEETIRFLLKLHWWDMDVVWLKENWALLCNISQMKDYFNIKK